MLCFACDKVEFLRQKFNLSENNFLEWKKIVHFVKGIQALEKLVQSSLRRILDHLRLQWREKNASFLSKHYFRVCVLFLSFSASIQFQDKTLFAKVKTYFVKMAAKSTTPSNEQLEMDQMAEAEFERLQKQVLFSMMKSEQSSIINRLC